MIKFENLRIDGFEPAIRGMRNPKNSWDKSDSTLSFGETSIGKKDRDLAVRLAGAGPVHGKFRRMIAVWVDITAPLYWWKQFDTYKVGTVADSCSTMHKIHDKEFTRDDFSCELLKDVHDCSDDGCRAYNFSKHFDRTIAMLNLARELYLKSGARGYWDTMIQMLPSSYNQKRTVMMNYEVLSNIYKYRKNHKLAEWHVFCDWIECLPYADIILADCENSPNYENKKYADSLKVFNELTTAQKNDVYNVEGIAKDIAECFDEKQKNMLAVLIEKAIMENVVDEPYTTGANQIMMEEVSDILTDDTFVGVN